MTNVHDLMNLLKNIRSCYQSDYKKAIKEKESELAKLKRTMIPNTPEYKNKEQEIQLACDIAIIKAREKAAKEGTEAIEELREWEQTGVSTINETALTKINMLRGIPLSTTELQLILKKYGSKNYLCQRAIAALAEENGISTTDLPLAASLDTKLSVLDGLSKQLDLLLEHYSPTAETREAAEARFLYLNDDVLNNSIEIYNNGVKDLSETDAVTRAYCKIKAMSGQMQKACAITNALRNLKKEDSKNLLLYKLATDNTIMAEAYQVAGISDVIAEWKHGKAERYTKAMKMIESIKTMQDTEKIKERLRGYINRVEMGSETENEFLGHEITKTYKKNTFIGKALQEMDSVERKMLLENNQPTEDSSSKTDKKTAEDSYAIAYKAALDRKSGNQIK